jgi:hypothetical protein
MKTGNRGDNSSGSNCEKICNFGNQGKHGNQKISCNISNRGSHGNKTKMIPGETL